MPESPNLTDEINSKPFRLALVGCGRRAGLFLQYFHQNPRQGQIVAICDQIPEKAGLLAKSLGLQPLVFGDVASMLKSVRPDALVICTPDHAHVEPAVLALDENIHVFCEKPMATTLADCDTIIEAAKKSSAIFYLGFNLRHSPMHETIHRLITDGRLGKITTIEANEYYFGGRSYFRRWNRLEKFGGGLWLTKACHDFDLLNWMVGAEPQTVYAVTGLSRFGKKPEGARQCRDCSLKFECPDYFDIFNSSAGEKEQLWLQIRLIGERFGLEPGDLCLYNSDKDTFDNGMAVVTYAGDVRTSYTVSVVAARTTRQMRVVGTEAMAEGDMERGTVEVTECYSSQKYTYDLRAQMSGGHGGADDRMIKHFLQACHTGKKPRSSWAEGRLAVQVSLAARESSQKGQIVTLK